MCSLFEVDLALRGGVKNHECNQGVCMKMVIQQKKGQRSFQVFLSKMHGSLYLLSKGIEITSLCSTDKTR